MFGYFILCVLINILFCTEMSPSVLAELCADWEEGGCPNTSTPIARYERSRFVMVDLYLTLINMAPVQGLKSMGPCSKWWCWKKTFICVS